MKNRTILFTALIFIFLSCNKKANQLENEDFLNNFSKESPIEINESKEDFSKNAELFANHVLKENIRTHNFDFLDSNNPRFLNTFQHEGLIEIVAYSNKNYPKKNEPNYYEHFILFVAHYESSMIAKKCFEQIKLDSNHESIDLENQSKEQANRMSYLSIAFKPAGFIVQKGKQIFCLVETCRNTPLQGSWVEYENKFLEFLTENTEEIEVLNADCGGDRFNLEVRKTNN